MTHMLRRVLIVGSLGVSGVLPATAQNSPSDIIGRLDDDKARVEELRKADADRDIAKRAAEVARRREAEAEAARKRAEDERRKAAAETQRREAEAETARKQEAEQRQKAADAEKYQREREERKRRPAGLFGPVLLGLRLGMKIEEADRAIRQRMSVDEVLQVDLSQEPNAAMTPLSWRRYYINAGLSEVVSVFSDPSSVGRVVSLVRLVQMPDAKTTFNAYTPELIRTYGSPSIVASRGAGPTYTDSLLWGDGLTEQNSVCPWVSNFGSIPSMYRSQIKTVKSSLAQTTIAYLATPANKALIMNSDNRDYIDKLKECPIMVRAEAIYGDKPYLVVSVIDSGWAATLYEETRNRYDQEASEKVRLSK